MARGMGDLNFCGLAAKYVIFFFNFMVMIGGLVLLVIGILGITGAHNYAHVPDVSQRVAGVLLIASGFVVMFFSCLGCSGAIRENKTMLVTYIVLVSLVFLLVFATTVLSFLSQATARDSIEGWMKDSMPKYDPTNKNDSVTQAWDTMQNQVQCCGIYNSTDWTTLGNLPEPPQSCCRPQNETCDTANPDALFPRGCWDIVSTNTEYATGIVGYVSIIFALILLLAIILSCCVACSLD